MHGQANIAPNGGESIGLATRTREPRCRICRAPVGHTFADLGMSPLCESLLPATPLNQMEPFYPLHALVCEKCFLVQLQEYVSPDHILSEHAYFSSCSTSWVAHARVYCHMIKERLQLGPQSLAV